MKEKILSLDLQDGQIRVIVHEDKTRLVVCMSEKRARKDRQNHQKGLTRLQKRVESGKLTKQALTTAAITTI